MNKILISYGEISLKKGNRNYFEQTLKKNIYDHFKKRDIKINLKKLYGKMLLESKEDKNRLVQVLQKVFGISKIVPVIHLNRNYEALKNNILEIIKEKYDKNKKLKFCPSSVTKY